MRVCRLFRATAVRPAGREWLDRHRGCGVEHAVLAHDGGISLFLLQYPIAISPRSAQAGRPPAHRRYRSQPAAIGARGSVSRVPPGRNRCADQRLACRSDMPLCAPPLPLKKCICRQEARRSDPPKRASAQPPRRRVSRDSRGLPSARRRRLYDHRHRQYPRLASE